MDYERTYYGGILLDEEKLVKNNIYRNIEVEYYKISREQRTLFQGKRRIFGLEVVMREYANNDMKVEEKRILSLTKNEKIIEKILEKLKEHTVTPTTLNDVITDMFY